MGNSLDFVLADVFSSRISGGNQLAVFPNAPDLSEAAMAAIARELKLNETVFVTGRERGGIRARIFSPHGELPFAGHPVIGTACLLGLDDAALRRAGELTLRVPAGDIPVRLSERDTGLHAMLQCPKQPERLETSATARNVAAMLGLTTRDLDSARPAAGYSGGIPFFCVPLADRQALRRAQLDREKWARTLSNTNAPHIYLFAIEEGEIFARMFAPAVGIEEDPATGAAAVALAGLLAKGAPDGRYGFRIHQGEEIGRPSIIDLEFDAWCDSAVRVWVGGTSVVFGQGSLIHGFSEMEDSCQAR